MLFPDQKSLTVSQINGLIRDVLNMGFPNSVWICGEIQGFDRNRDKKHIFFELCEKDAATKDIVARVGLVIFANRKAYIDEVLAGAQNAFALKDDIEVKFLCKVDFYPPHGAVRLVVEAIDPVYTLGKIAQERQKIIALLKQKGVLDKNKTVELPLVPLNIGLVTAYDSAAYNDFISELRLSGLGFKVFCRNTVMQGKNAEKDVCAALDYFDRREDIDVVVITRGGGSIAELSCFDSVLIAERIASAGIPVLSGIGHEINVTVTDLAAHTYQKTPTAIAQFLVARVEGFLTGLEEKFYAMIERARAALTEERSSLKATALDFKGATLRYLKEHEQKLVRAVAIIKRYPLRNLVLGKDKIVSWQKEVLRGARQRLGQERARINSFAKVAAAVDPGNTLRRGFSITRDADGKVIKSSGQVKADERIFTALAEGEIVSRVEGKSCK